MISKSHKDGGVERIYLWNCAKLGPILPTLKMLYSEIECWNKSQMAQSRFPSLFLRELCAKLVDQELAVSLHFGEIWKVSVSLLSKEVCLGVLFIVVVITGIGSLGPYLPMAFWRFLWRIYPEGRKVNMQIWFKDSRLRYKESDFLDYLETILSPISTWALGREAFTKVIVKMK